MMMMAVGEETVNVLLGPVSRRSAVGSREGNRGDGAAASLINKKAKKQNSHSAATGWSRTTTRLERIFT